MVASNKRSTYSCVASYFTCPVQSYCTGVCDVAVQGLAGFQVTREKSCPSLFSLDTPVSSAGQALLNTKQNKISQGRLIKSGMTVCVVIPANPGSESRAGAGIQRSRKDRQGRQEYGCKQRLLTAQSHLTAEGAEHAEENHGPKSKDTNH